MLGLIVPLSIATNTYGYLLFTPNGKLSWKRVFNPLTIAVLLGMALGALGYGFLLRPILLPVWRFWVDTMVEFLHLVWLPVNLLWKTAKKACRFLKKLFHFWQKYATMTLYLWKCFLFSEKEQGKGAKHEEKTAKEKPRRHRAAGGGAADWRGRL